MASNCAPNSSGGPDEVPYSALRSFKFLFLLVLLLIITALTYGTHEPPLWFNVALMILIPKDSCGTTEFGLLIFAPDCMRPLSLGNAINTLVANTIRISFERFASTRFL